MVEIFLKTLPFFALIALGFQACRTGFFTAEAAAYLTKFVFYFALSAMLFRFAANLSLAEIFDWWFVAAYLWGCFVVYLLATAVAMLHRRPVAEAAVEAQCAVIGNTGFLGVPMLVVLLGEAAAGPVLMVLTLDLVVFSSLIVILVTGSREGRVRLSTLKTVGLGLLKNPMIVSIVLGLAWSSTGWDVPGPINEFLAILGAAATPGALFAIGASLAGKSAERMSVAGWLSFCKLVLHPAAVALAALVLFPVDIFDAAVMIAAASLPVAGNVYILAQHYGVAPQRVSTAILVSTAISILTVSVIIGWVSQMAGITLGG
ncbi:malonate transporter [Roseibacterium elongatum DSM 19469]|uniref:Malonate transporter n=1 Tax=Roseicyclus elongatus DSM 19469 TaxID=1294273 RepID=W8RR26_9RHOB|nr:AEC family transporter [Roseibacterium elongatum]AHM03528.1 malonate transporter [Roseibacterium elongatum DSM 19469]